MREEEERRGEITSLATEIISIARREESERRRLGRRRGERRGEGGEISLSPLRAHACKGKRRREGKGEKSSPPLPHAHERTRTGE